MRKTLAKICAVAVLGCIPVVFSAVPAQADPSPTRGTGLIGGCNMLNDPTMFTVAMAHASDRGDEGMFTGVAASGDPGCQVSLGG
jgi:hypothetical protein